MPIQVEWDIMIVQILVFTLTWGLALFIGMKGFKFIKTKIAIYKNLSPRKRT